MLLRDGVNWLLLSEVPWIHRRVLQCLFNLLLTSHWLLLLLNCNDHTLFLLQRTLFISTVLLLQFPFSIRVARGFEDAVKTDDKKQADEQECKSAHNYYYRELKYFFLLFFLYFLYHSWLIIIIISHCSDLRTLADRLTSCAEQFVSETCDQSRNFIAILIVSKAAEEALVLFIVRWNRSRLTIVCIFVLISSVCAISIGLCIAIIDVSTRLNWKLTQ